MLKYAHRKDMKDENSINKVKDYFKKIKNLIIWSHDIFYYIWINLYEEIYISIFNMYI